MKNLISLIDFVLWLNSMTTTELLNQFPGRFHLPDGGETIVKSSMKYFMNQSILFDFTKQYARFLVQPLILKMFIGEKALFNDFGIYKNFEDKQVLKTLGSNQVYAYLNHENKFRMNFPRGADIIADLIPSKLTLTEFAIKSIIK